jgi:hypothetical protein
MDRQTDKSKDDLTACYHVSRRKYYYDNLMLPVRLRLKVKVALRSFSTRRPLGSIVFLPQHIQRRHASYRCGRPLPAKAGTITPDFASRSVIYKNPLGSLTCRKAGTWDILFYFLSEGRHTEDFPDARKIQRLRPGLNPRT